MQPVSNTFVWDTDKGKLRVGACLTRADAIRYCRDWARKLTDLFPDDDWFAVRRRR
jgi:hypothetical protein